MAKLLEKKDILFQNLKFVGFPFQVLQDFSMKKASALSLSTHPPRHRSAKCTRPNSEWSESKRLVLAEIWPYPDCMCSVVQCLCATASQIDDSLEWWKLKAMCYSPGHATENCWISTECNVCLLSLEMIYRDAWWCSKLLIKSTYNAHLFAIVICTCIHARMHVQHTHMIPCSWAPPFRHRYGIRILLAKHDAQPSPTQALKTELGELKLTLGNVQSKSSSETRGIVGLVVYGLGWESDDGNDVGPGEQGEHVCKGVRLMPDDLVFIWLRSQSVDNKLYKLPWFTSEVAWNAGQDR